MSNQSQTASTSLMSYVNAGYMSFRMAFSTAHFGAPTHRPYRVDNPYTKRPFNKLWRRGWDEAQREFDSDPPLCNFRYKPFEENVRIKEFVRQIEQRERYKNRKRRDDQAPDNRNKGQQKPYTNQQHRSQRPNPAQASRPQSGNKPKDNTGSLNFKKLERFNQKHRTAA